MEIPLDGARALTPRDNDITVRRTRRLRRDDISRAFRKRFEIIVPDVGSARASVMIQVRLELCRAINKIEMITPH